MKTKTLTTEKFFNGGIFEPERIKNLGIKGWGIQELDYALELLKDLYANNDLHKYISSIKIYFNPNTGEVYAKGKGIKGSLISPDGGNDLKPDWEIKGYEEPFKWERKNEKFKK